MKVSTYCINKGQPSQYFGLKNSEENQVLHAAPNNWKTEKGALNWAKKHGYDTSKGKNMANKKSTKPKSAKPSKPNQTSKPKPATKPSGGFTPVSKTVITTYQNSKGVKRTVRETTVAPGAKTKTAKKCVPAKNGKGASKK